MLGKKILVVGLGHMGSALALTLIKNGYGVAVWNRTQSKTEPLLAAGASLASNIAEGIRANDLIVICLGNYGDAVSALGDVGDFSGKTLIHLTTATVSEAKAMEASVIEKGGLYLDGEILGYPSAIGEQDGRLVVAGSGDAWREAEPVVMCLGPDSRYLGENVSAPSALSAGLMFSELAILIGVTQGVLIVEKEGIDVGEYFEMAAEAMRRNDGSDILRQGNAIARGDFKDTEGALETWSDAISGMVKGHEALGINVEFPRVLDKLLKRAVAAGYGREEIASVIKVLRG
jgi:3-hydroxyisobutyrate dehydrogenase-like beta-hydroxyacid dehydrogenase